MVLRRVRRGALMSQIGGNQGRAAFGWHCPGYASYLVRILSSDSIPWSRCPVIPRTRDPPDIGACGVGDSRLGNAMGRFWRGVSRCPSDPSCLGMTVSGGRYTKRCHCVRAVSERLGTWASSAKMVRC